MLDGPYNNNVWNGREIAVVEVPAGAARSAQTFKVAVPAVEGLTGKHAIYLVAEGPDIKPSVMERPGGPRGRRQAPQRPEGLFDLHGIGFEKAGAACEPPVVPTVDIFVDGIKLVIPDEPIKSSNTNGYTDATHYQLYAPLTSSSKIEVKSTPNVVVRNVSPIVAGRASVQCTYQGCTKTFLIN